MTAPLTLALFVALNFADHSHDTFAANDFAPVTNRLYRCTHFHGAYLNKIAYDRSPTLLI
jgi:hypothetical protein